MIDTLKYTKDLEAAGLSRGQAETIVGAQFRMISENVATKADIKELEYKFTLEIQKVITKLGTTVVASVSALGVFLGFFIKFF